MSEKIGMTPLEYAETWNNKGIALSDIGKNKEAIDAYDKAIQINPEYAEAWNNKGIALSGIGKNKEAFKAYDKAIEINPEYSEAWNNKGIALSDIGKYKEAIDAYDKAIQINPKYAETWNNKGIALSDIGKNKEASEAYDKAIEIDPKYAGVWFRPSVNIKLLNLPGFKWAQRIYKNELKRLVKKQRESFYELDSISDEKKNCIYPRIVEVTMQMATLDAFRSFLKILSIIAFLLSFTIGLLIAFYPLQKIFLTSPDDYTIQIFIKLFLVLIIILFTFFIIVRSSLVAYKYWPILLFSYVLLLLTIYIYQEIGETLGIIGLGLLWGLAGGVVYFLILICSFSLLFLFDIIIGEKKSRYLDSEIIDLLFKTLYKAEAKDYYWNEIEFRKKLNLELELIADKFEFKMSHRFPSYDSNTKVWIKKCCHEMASGIRYLRRYILMPKKESKKQLTDILANRLVNAVNGYWDEFERIEVSENRSIKSKIVFWSQRIIVAFLPIFLIIVINYLSFPIFAPIINYLDAAFIIVFIWLLFNIIFWFDPELNEKISTFKNITDIKLIK